MKYKFYNSNIKKEMAKYVLPLLSYWQIVNTQIVVAVIDGNITNINQHAANTNNIGVILF